MIQPILATTRGPGIRPLSMACCVAMSASGLPARSTAVVTPLIRSWRAETSMIRRVVRAMRAVPVLVVRVAEDVQVHVDVDEPGHDGHPGGVDDLCTVGDCQRFPATRRDDAVAVDGARSRRAGAVPRARR